MSRSANAARMASEVAGDGGIGVPNGITTWIETSSRTPRRTEVLVQQERRLARRRRALERGSAHADDRRARRECGKHPAYDLGARDRVELVAGFDEARGRVEVVVGPQRDDQDVGLVAVEIRHHLPPGGIDRGDGFLTEPDVRPREVAVEQANGLGRPLAEHHIELRETEHERIGPVDQRDVDLIAELLREPGRQFQPTEAGSEDEDGRRHRPRIVLTHERVVDAAG